MSKETLDPYLIADQEAQSRLDVENPSSSRQCSLISDHLEAQKCGLSVLKTYNSIGFGFHIGDMVWGKVKSHPWWPGHIYNETFASSSVRRTKREGHVLVAFFGDSSYGWFELAELVHFDSNFSEKSKQTTAKNFVKAVDEAVDEASRRAALGLICRCRNPYNFRSVNITGYFAVNVLDYDVGVYSSSQIIQARELFQPEKTLDFLKDLALTAYGESRNIESIKQKATVLIYRKIVFEEFDETYAQAFGLQPVRPSLELTCTTEPSPGASSRAPLSGPMVFAETDDKGSSAKPAKVKNSNKRDRYLFKRRDEFKKESDEHSDDLILQKKDGADSIILPKQSDVVDDIQSSSFLHDPKEEEEEEATRIQSPVLPFSESENGVLLDLKNTHSSDGDGGHDFSSIVDEEMKPGSMNVAQSKDCKHPNDDQSCRKGIPPEKKMKLMKETEREEEKSDMVMEEQVIPGSIAVASFSVPENVDLDPWKLLLDLKSLALDPFHGADRKCQLFVQALVLNFRSAVYQKSLVLSPPPEKDNSDLPRRIEEQKDPPPPLPPPPPCKQLKVPEFRSSDPTKSGRKRGLHHKNEEKTAKKTKKLVDLKATSAEKRTKQKPKEDAKKQSSRLEFPSSVKSKPQKTQSLPKIEDPAMLVIKFPGKTAIPSIGELKVKFSRFGQLDPEGTRVFWNTNTCRVVFRHKSDAMAAHKHTIESKSFFANAAVKCQLREIEQSNLNPNPPSTPLKLKSCLKKPAAVAAATAARGVSRVKFMLEEESMVGECKSRRKIESEKWNYNNTSSSNMVEEENVDISMQMFTLLRRCSEIVASLKTFLGYLPYRPL